MVLSFARRHLTTAIVAILLATCGLAPAAPPAGYTLSWADEFGGSSLSTANWDYRIDTRFWSVQQAASVSVSDGYLKLHLKKETVGDFDYTSGGVISKPEFRYGYYETSMKTPPGVGWHTSFWMMRNSSGAATGTSATYIELDALENDSVRPTQYSVNLHRWQPSHTTFGTKTINTPNLSAGFHTIGCEFMPSYVKYYFDGVVVQTVDATQFPHSDLNVWLTSVAAPLGGTPAVDDSQLPAVALYDYARYYSPDVSTAQKIHQWNGTTNTEWATSANWSASPGAGATGATYNARLQVYNGNGAGLIYDGSLGTTRYYNVYERGLVVGNFGSDGSMTITGGSFSTYNSSAQDVIANTAGVTGTLTVAGGTFIGNIFGTILNFGGGATGKLIVDSGEATFSKLILSNTNAGASSVDLNGGVLTANQILTNATSGASSFNFNGGTLRAATSSTVFMQGLQKAYIKSAGAIIDTNGKNVTIAQPLLTDPNSAGGGLTKRGAGTLTLSGTSTYTGRTIVEAGTLSIVPADLTGSAPAGNYLPDAGDVHLFSGGLLNLSTNGLVDTVGQLFVDGVNLPRGVYGGVGSAAALGFQLAQITGNGLLNVTGFRLAGDIDGNGNVDVADYTVWRDALGTVVTPGSGADVSGDGEIGLEDYDLWRKNFGSSIGNVTAAATATSAPEPAAAVLLLLSMISTKLMQHAASNLRSTIPVSEMRYRSSASTSRRPRWRSAHNQRRR